MKSISVRRTPPEFLRKYFYYSEIDWSVLKPSELTLIQRSKSLIDVRRNQVVFDAGTSPKGVYVVTKGKIKLSIRMPDGAEQIVFIYTPGETFGYRPLIICEKHAAVAAALESGQIEFIPADVFLKVLRQSQPLNQELLNMLCHEFSVWINRLAFISQKNVKQRMALALLVLNEKFKARESLLKTSAIHLSKTELASMVGTSLETVIRTLKKFVDQSLVKVKGKHFVIGDESELMRIAGLLE